MVLIKKKLLDVLFSSKKRKEVLLLLNDGAKKTDFLFQSLETTRQALLPQIRILEDHHLIIQSGDTFELTTIGKLIVEKMLPLLDTVQVLDVDIDYWGTHMLDFIPPHLLRRMNELRKCEVMKPSHVHLYDLNKTVMQTSFMSIYHCALCTFYHPHFPNFFSSLIDNNSDVYFVTTPEVIDKLRAEHIEDFEKLLKNNLFHLYVCSVKMDFLAVIYNNYHLLLRPLKNDGEIDSQHVLCSSPEALEWATDLFEYYLGLSTRITEI